MQNNPFTPDDNTNGSASPDQDRNFDELANAQPHRSTQPSFENYRDYDAELSGLEDSSPVSAQPAPPMPAQSPAAATPTTSHSDKSPKKPRRRLVVGLIVAGALALLGGSVALGYNLWYQNPDKVLTDALKNLSSGEPVTLSGHLTGNTSDSLAKLSFNGQLDANIGQLEATLDVSQDQASYKMSGQAIIDSREDSDQALYVKLEQVEELLSGLAAQAGDDASMGLAMAIYGGLIKSVDNQWIRIDLEPSDDGDLMEDQRCASDKFADLIKKDSVTNELSGLYKKHRFVKVTERLDAKTINGVGSIGYQLGFDIDSLKQFTSELNDTELVRELKKCDADIGFDADSITTTQAEADEYDLEVYVSRFGHELMQVKLSQQEDGVDNELVVSFDHSQSVSIDIPKDSKTLEQIMEDFQNSFMQPAMDCSDPLAGCSPQPIIGT